MGRLDVESHVLLPRELDRMLKRRDRFREFPPDEGFAMPIWMEILLNVIGYAGFVAIATMNPCADEAEARQAQRDPVFNLTE